MSITLAKLFASRITSRFNKDVILLLVGERGSGKSMSALYLAHKTAEEVAKIKGGTWQDYFTMENVAVIDPASLLTKLQTLYIKPFSIFILDDAGVSWNSRNHATKSNILLNNILSVCRTSQSMIIITTISGDLIDKVPRQMASFHGEVAESYHHRGENYLKIFKMSKLSRAGKVIYSHLTFHEQDGTSSKIVRWVTRMPPQEIVNAYNKLRNENALELVKNHEKEKEELQSTHNKWEGMVAKYGSDILDMQQQQKTLQEMVHATGLSEYYVRKLKTTIGAF